jgi:hypothetical protein
MALSGKARIPPIGAESDPLFPSRNKSALSPSTPSQGSSNCNVKCACTRLDLALDQRSVVGSLVKLGTCSQATFFGHVCAKSISPKFQAQITPATSRASPEHHELMRTISNPSRLVCSKLCRVKTISHSCNTSCLSTCQSRRCKVQSPTFYMQKDTLGTNFSRCQLGHSVPCKDGAISRQLQGHHERTTKQQNTISERCKQCLSFLFSALVIVPFTRTVLIISAGAAP